MTLIAVIGLALTAVIGLWKFFGRKATEKRERIEKANTLFEEGMAERDPSKITASNSRTNNDV